MKAYNLKVNRLSRAIGIDSGTALLSWLVEGGVRQSAFRVVLKSGDKLLCDSGKVTSSATEYNTPIEIPSKTRVEWSVTLWDENDICGESTSAFFETSIDKSEWIAKWIDPELEHPTFSRRANLGAPLNKASYLKKEFTLDTLGNARLYATAHGVYNVYVNGVAIEEFYMAPGTSNYVDRLQVQTYDVTELLKVGKNELLMTIGEGWYRGSVGWGMARYSFGTEIALLCQLEINGKRT
jgi:alpha-L-rhamnosidase